MVHITNYKHKYNKYKQKYLNLLHGGADEIHIIHSKDLEELKELPFLVANDFIDGSIMSTEFVSLLDEQDKLQLQQVIRKVIDKSELTRELRQVLIDYRREKSKDKENINNELLIKLKQRNSVLLKQKVHTDASNNSVNKEIFDLLITFFITQYSIIINGKNYSIVSFVFIGGQGIVFRICTKGIRGMSNYIIKFAVHDNCDEILYEATALDTYYTANGTPTTFTPYKSLSHGKTGSLCFSVYDDVGNEDLCVFANIIKQLISTKVESMGSSEGGELHDRIMMIPYIIIQILLQLEYYKRYRHNDIRFENVVIDIRPTSPLLTAPIYQGRVLSLLRVTIIDFGKFYPPEHIEYSQIYIASPETLECWIDEQNRFQGVDDDKVYDKENSDLIGFLWTVVDLLIGKRCGTFVIDNLIRIVLSNEQNLLSIHKEDRDIYIKSGTLPENLRKKLLLFIYLSLNGVKDKYQHIFNSMVVDPQLTFEHVENILLGIHNDVNNKIIELLFSDDKSVYNRFIRNLLLSLRPCTSRPSIESCLSFCRTTFKPLINMF